MLNGSQIQVIIRRALVMSAVILSVLVGLVVGSTVSDGLWFLTAGIVSAPFALFVAHRRPELVFVAWFLFDPLLMIVEGEGVYRRIYWMVHRLMPLAVLGIVAGLRVIGERRLSRLGSPDVLVLLYVLASILSITYTSLEPTATFYVFYDRMLVPIILYFLVRLLAPTGDRLAKLMPVLAILLMTQSLFGLFSWVAPGALPEVWLNRAGSRTTGSLGHPNVYGTTLLAAATVLFHFAMGSSHRRTKIAGAAALTMGVVATFATLSRASWLAIGVVLAGIGLLYRRTALRFLLILVVSSALFGISPYAEAVGEIVVSRAQAEESALSRLPVVLASLRMFGDRPVVGFGFENFDRFDYAYVSSVGDLYVPDRDHASHNLYLTILAEQGLVGLVTYIGPAVVWFARSREAWRRLPSDGAESRRLLVLLWTILASHVVVNMFSNMRISFGISVWWLTLGMIGVLVTRATRPEDITRPDLDVVDFDHPLRSRTQASSPW